MPKLPKYVWVSDKVKIPVRLMRLNEKLGYFNGQEIAIESKQPDVAKHQILLHEIMHAAATKLVEHGVIKNHPSELFIQEFSGEVFWILCYSGLYKGMNRRAARKFLRNIKEFEVTKNRRQRLDD